MDAREIRSVSGVDFAWAIGSLAGFFRLPFDPGLLLQQFPPPYTIESVLQSAERLGMSYRRCDLRESARRNVRTPRLALLSTAAADAGSAHNEVDPPDDEAADAVPTQVPVLLTAMDAQRVVYFLPNEREPKEMPRAEFEARSGGLIVHFALKPEALSESDGTQSQAEFGFGWFIPELLKHRSIWRDVLMASLVIQLLAMATPLFTQVVIDKVVVHHTMNTLFVIGIGLAAFMLFSAALTWVRQYLVLHTGNRVDAVLGTNVFDHLLKLPIRYFEHRPTGVVVARIHGVETIREFVSGAAVTLILDLPFLFVFLAIMFWYSWMLTLIALGFLATIVGLSLAIVPLLRARLNQQFLLGARNQSFLTEYISGLETVKSLQMEPQLRSRFSGYLGSYLKASFGTRQLSNTYGVTANTLEQMMTLSLLCVGAWMVMQDKGFTIGMLVAFQMFSGRLSQPVLRIVGLWQEFQQAAIAVKRLGDVMNAPAEAYSVVPSREPIQEGRIDIANLSFRYARNLPYLYRNLDITIEPGRCVAVTGPSGCGKSTLAKLLQGFYGPDDGQIKLDDQDIANMPANEVRQCFGVVPQETVLFSGTIFENLILANPHASFEEVIQACRMAEIHDVIQQLPEGYKTRIGEHGSGLSGGQKQRLAIARALLKRPRILIFDEATSNLDQDTAEQFARTINRLKGKVTMLFIAHFMPKELAVDSVVRLGAPAVAAAIKRDVA